MGFKSVALLGLIFVVAVQAHFKRDFTKTARDCMTELKIDETTTRNLLTETGMPKTHDDTTEKFFECCLRPFIKDNNELTIDDRFKIYVTDVFTNRLEGRRHLAALLTRECIEFCRDTRGDTRGKTAFKTMTCFMTKLNDFLKKDTE